MDFMVIALPRSGTTWAANWLSCAHDPLYTAHYTDWDRLHAGSGVSCTGIWRWPEWVNAHPARKVILHRDAREVGASLHRIAKAAALKSTDLDAIDGLHVPWTDLFDTDRAEVIWETLRPGERFDSQRHAALTSIKMEPNFATLPVDHALQRRLWSELSQVKG